MSSPRGRLAAAAVAGLFALLPSATQAQCQHMGQRQNGGGQGMQMSSMQGQLQWMAMQQMQMIAMTQLQPVALQQQMAALQQMQMIALRQPQLNPIRQQANAPLPLVQGGQPPLPGLAHQKAGELLQEMTSLQKRMDGLELAAQHNQLQPPDTSAVQQAVNALQDKVSALAKPPSAVVERMAAVRQQSDDLLRLAAARPEDLIASYRNSSR